MATSTGIDVDYHRRLALECMAPGELRDDYLCWLDGVERQARLAASLPEEPERAPAPAPDDAASRWTAQRYVAVAIGSVVFAAGTWLLTSLS